MPLVVDSGDPTDQLNAFVDAVDKNRSVVVTTSQWSDPLRVSAAQDVAKVRALENGPFISQGKLVVFTSGSAGKPRAVVRSLDSWRASVQPLADLLEMGDREVVWSPGPLTSTLSLYGAWHARQLGHEAVLGYRAHPSKLSHITIAHVVPSMMPTIADGLSRGMLPRLRRLVVAGDRVPERARAEWTERGVELSEYYGSAELSFAAWRTPAGFVAFPGAQVEVRDGRLWVSSPYLSEGYLAPDESAPFTLTDGWGSVGDRAEWLDESAGTFDVLGRGDETVTTGGVEIPVADIEAQLKEVPGVDEVVVTDAPTGGHGEGVAAVIVGQPDWAMIREVVNAMPAQARPLRWAQPSSVPRLPGGKLDRAMIRVALLDGALSSGPLPSA